MSIHFDERGFGTDEQRVSWGELVAVAIRTTADGPLVEDTFWQFLTADRCFELPASVVGSGALTVMQRQLPGLDSLEIVRAMGSTRERVFRVWHVEESRTPWDDARGRARFASLVARLGGDAARAPAAFDRLREAWSAEPRRYHDLEHLGDCLRELDGARLPPEAAGVVELALWYHDAVYAPGAPDNEARSARLLLDDGAALGLPPGCLEAAAACVRATAHLAGAAPEEPLAALTVDLDLSILGKDPLRFLEYEHGIEEEHARVPRLAFVLARGRFLSSLLARPAIFHTEALRARYEARARANLTGLLASPRYRLHRWLGRIYARVC